MKTAGTVETTLGNLIKALTEETFPYVHDEKEAYEIVAFMLAHLLRNSSAISNRQRRWH